jgi:hypothetical protein
MQNQVQKLNPESITRDVYIIAPTLIEYIAHIFGNTVADTMNIRPFAQKSREIAEQSLRHALQSAKHMGEKK